MEKMFQSLPCHETSWTALMEAACNVLRIAYGLQIANAAVLMTNMFGVWPQDELDWVHTILMQSILWNKCQDVWLCQWLTVEDFPALRAKCCFWLASVMRTSDMCCGIFLRLLKRGHRHLTLKPWIDVRSLESHWHFFAFYLSVGFNAGIFLASQHAGDTQFFSIHQPLKRTC